MSAREPTARLGRGLAALLGDAPTPRGGTAAGVQPIPIDLLSPGPFQPRGPIAAGSLGELTESIRARGVLQPLLVRPHPAAPERYQIIAGERRWRAAQAAGLHEVPALIRALADAEAMAAALVENLQRQDLNAIEEAEGYRRLLDEFGLTQEALAQGVGKSRSHIANTLRLLNLPASVQIEVRNGALSAGHARALLGHPDPERAALVVVARALNVRQTEALARRAVEGAARGDGRDRPADPHTTTLERMLSERLGLRVDIRFDGRRGSLRVQYESLDQLDGLIALLTRE